MITTCKEVELHRKPAPHLLSVAIDYFHIVHTYRYSEAEDQQVNVI